MFLAIGIGALLVALALTLVLLRLNRTLFVIDALVETLNEEVRQTLPEVRESLGNVNEITSGVNVALQSAGTGLGRFRVRMRHALRERALDLAAAWHGVQVATETYAEAAQASTAEHPNGDVPAPVGLVSAKEESDG
jgi:hypothetical protein